jgi:hypothetical protein
LPVGVGRQNMVYRGHVEKGVIRFEEGFSLPEGAEVEVRFLAKDTTREAEIDPKAPTIEEKIAAIWADVPPSEWARLPADLTDHLDHYIYGTPK